jgi:hypothetical protein
VTRNSCTNSSLCGSLLKRNSNILYNICDVTFIFQDMLPSNKASYHKIKLCTPRSSSSLVFEAASVRVKAGGSAPPRHSLGPALTCWHRALSWLLEFLPRDPLQFWEELHRRPPSGVPTRSKLDPATEEAVPRYMALNYCRTSSLQRVGAQSC